MKRTILHLLVVLSLTLSPLVHGQDSTLSLNTFGGIYPNNLQGALDAGYTAYNWVVQRSGFLEFRDLCGGWPNFCGGVISTMPINFGSFDTLTLTLDASAQGGTFWIAIEDSFYYHLYYYFWPTSSYQTYEMKFYDTWTNDPSFDPTFAGSMRIAIIYINNNKNQIGRIRNLSMEGTPTTVWLGDYSTDWFTETNWSAGIPRWNRKAIIPYRPAGVGRPHYPFVVGQAESADLVIEDNAYVAITPHGSLKAYGEVTMGGGYNVSVFGDSSGMGSFIDNGLTGPGKGYVEEFVSGDRWHFMSSPISNGVSFTFNRLYLLPYNEPTSSWGNYVVPSDYPLNVMKGYAVWSSTVWPPRGDTIVSYNGYLNSGPQSIAISNSGFKGDPEHDGWNLVGNPYPSGLHWDSSGWVKDNLANTIYLWMPDVQNYGIYNGSTGIGINGATGEIPVGQGFFVKALGNGNLGVDNRARIHPSRMIYKTTQAKSISNLLRLSISGAGFQDEAVLRFHADASSGFDAHLDAFKLFTSNPQVPQLFSKTLDTVGLNLAINSLPELHQGVSVPLSLKYGSDGVYSLSISQLESFPSNMELYLEDLVADSIQDVRIHPTYSFSVQSGNAIDRFLLHFNPISMSGIISYNMDPGLPISDAKIILKDLFHNQVSTSVSSSHGTFKLGNVEDGLYFATAEVSTSPWGGVNSTDALLVSRHFVGMHTLTPMQVLAADVDASSYLNNADALAIMKRYVGMLTEFPSGDWCIPDVPITIQGQATYTMQLGALCYGDVNASYTANIKSNDAPLVLPAGSINIERNITQVILPISAGASGHIGAISLEASIEPGLALQNITTPHGGTFIFRQEDSKVYISWIGIEGMNVGQGDLLFSMHFDIQGSPEPGKWLSLAVSSEIANTEGKALQAFPLWVPDLSYPGNDPALLTIYPNPCTDRATVSLTAHASDSRVVIEILDVTGRLVRYWTDQTHAGIGYERTIDLKGLSLGIYTLKAMFTHPGLPAASAHLIIVP